MRRTTRKGFTLVEMLVAMALVILIMAILSEAFVIGLEAFRKLKAVGDMNEKLRNTAIRLRSDLKANHFDGDRRLANVTTNTNPPELGFFAAGMSLVGTEVIEGADGDGIVSRRGFSYVHMTCRLNGNGWDSFYRGKVPLGSPLDAIGRPESRHDVTNGNFANGSYSSQWAEVVWFLKPQLIPNTNPPQQKTTGGLPLYNLHRRQLLLVPDLFTSGTSLVAAPLGVSDANYWQNYDISAFGSPPPSYAFNSPKMIQNLPNRFPKRADKTGVVTYLSFEEQIPNPPGPTDRWGTDIVLTNVLSFSVSVFPNYGSNQLTFENALNPTNFPPDNVYPSGGVYDTAVNASTGIKAIKVEIRVWDEVTHQTRQVTIIQDM